MNVDPRRLRKGRPARMCVWDVRDDDDYGDPTRRMMIAAVSAEAAESLWDCPFTEENVYARPMNLKGRQLRVPGAPRVLHTQDLTPRSASEAA